MTRLPPVDPADESPELRTVFDELRRTRSRVPLMYRTLAHQPAILAAHRAYFDAALDAGVLPRAFKEKIAFKVAKLRGSAYSSASHRRYAFAHGVTEEELAAIERSDYSQLDPGERSALVFAEEVVARRGAVSEESFAALAGHHSAAEVVEIAALVGIMELASTLGAVFALGAEGDPG
jgi:AhpD family alkylhydroperoxidase